MSKSNSFQLELDRIASTLIKLEHGKNGSMLSVPILYPSGASAVVEVTQHGEKYFVSDLGFGFAEAEMFGASHTFTRHAAQLAHHYGVKFDNQSFFVAEASRDFLASVVTVVANCSVESANFAAIKAADRRYVDDTEEVYNRLIDIFPKDNVLRNNHFIGSSNYKWPVAAIVTSGSRPTIFELVSKHHNSVVNAATKFSDIARLEKAPNRVVLVKDFSDMDNYLSILNQSATVLEISADPEKIRILAA